jgi:ubiquinone/menaquinone biosynthesis C-methylase UbiE
MNCAVIHRYEEVSSARNDKSVTIFETSPNTRQIEFWNGPVGEKWSFHQARLDLVFAPLTKALIAAAKASPGETAYEIGCGCGDLTLAVAESLGPQGKIIAVDVSKPMLERAEARALEAKTQHFANIEFINADAMEYALNSVADLAISRFGVMFFADPLAAFKNIYRGLRPRGRLAILCWCPLDENPWVNDLFSVISDLAPQVEPLLCDVPLLEQPGPYAFADQHQVCSLLEKAGFAKVKATRIAAKLCLGETAPHAVDRNSAAVDEALILALQVGPVSALLREANLDLQKLVEQRIKAKLESLVLDGKIELLAACWLYEAEIQDLK